MATRSRTMEWIWTILLVVVIIIAAIGVYTMTDRLSAISTKQDENYTNLSQAISSLNVTGALGVIASGAPTTGTVPLTVSFTSTPVGGRGPYTYSWNFGDGTAASTLKNPSHQYTSTGTYTAKVTITDSTGTTATYSLTVQVLTGVTLTVFSLWGGSEEANFKQALANFTAQTGIAVNHFSYTTEDLLIGVPMQLKSGTSIADVILAPWPAWVLELAPHLTSVNDLLTPAKYPTNIIGPVTDTNNVIWGAPFKLSGKPGFWYRKSFFANNGLTVPTTYAEFQTLLADISAIPGIEQAVASGNTVGWPLSDTTESFIMGLGGYQLQEQLIAGPSQRNWTDTQVRNVFEQLRLLLAAGYFSPPAEWTSQITKLWEGKYGIYFMGSWMTAMPQILNLTDLDFFGFPGTDGVAGSVDYAIIPKYAPHLTEAKQLVQWLAGPQAQEIMVSLGGFFGTHVDVPASAYKPLDKKVLDFISQATIHIVPDLDDAIGGKFQTTFWAQLKLLWVDPTPTTLNDVLTRLQEQALAQQT